MQKNVNWTITDLNDRPSTAKGAAGGRRPAGGGAQRRSDHGGKRARRRIRVRPFVPSGVLLLIGVFIIMLTILFLHSWTVSLNEDVRSLQDDLSKINSEIDSKNGRLISNADLKTIEGQARALGMTEAQSSQYVYEAAAKKQSNVSDRPAGLYDYISFFVQLREENLWPKRQ